MSVAAGKPGRAGRGENPQNGVTLAACAFPLVDNWGSDVLMVAVINLVVACRVVLRRGLKGFKVDTMWYVGE